MEQMIMTLRLFHLLRGSNGQLIGSSEKSRIPAWCDRVLRRGDNLRQINYTTAPLRFSDHRPVYATFQCTISNIDEPLKESLSHEIYTKRKSYVGKTTNASSDTIDDEDLIGYESIAPELPPASSDRRKWWLDQGGDLLYVCQTPENS